MRKWELTCLLKLELEGTGNSELTILGLSILKSVEKLGSGKRSKSIPLERSHTTPAL